MTTPTLPLEQAVLAVLRGEEPGTVAIRHRLTVQQLLAAHETFVIAGRVALSNPPSDRLAHAAITVTWVACAIPAIVFALAGLPFVLLFLEIAVRSLFG